VLIVEPQAALEAADFERLVQAVDPFIEQAGGLNGLMIYSDSFPGWDDFQALGSHTSASSATTTRRYAGWPLLPTARS
jgi:hypothetical protein